MKKIILYEYDKRNREDFLKQLEDAGYRQLNQLFGEARLHHGCKNPQKPK